MKTAIISDTHFGHKKIIQYANRPFANIKEMDEKLIINWNSIINPEDTVRFLGDFAFCCTLDYALNIVKRLNGHKHLIVGNHDQLALQMNTIRPNTWESIKDMDEINVDGQKIVLCHYPLAHWHHEYRGVWSLYGHHHGTFQNTGKSVDAGVDKWNYFPVTMEQLHSFMKNRPIGEIIHNKWDKGNDEITTL